MILFELVVAPCRPRLEGLVLLLVALDLLLQLLEVVLVYQRPSNSTSPSGG